MYPNLKLTLLVIFFIVFVDSLTAQISIGIQGGLNSAILKLSNKAPEAELSYNDVLVLGTIINYEINKMFSLQSEPRFIQKGQRVKFDMSDLKADSKIFFNYLELPIYFVTEFTESQLRPFVLGGINLGYLLKVKAKSNYNGNEMIFDITDDYKKIDIAVDLGIGLKYEITSTADLLLNTRYSYGIYDISKLDGSINTRGIQILIGLLYKLN